MIATDSKILRKVKYFSVLINPESKYLNLWQFFDLLYQSAVIVIII